jgi:hypothetical protein
LVRAFSRKRAASASVPLIEGMLTRSRWRVSREVRYEVASSLVSVEAGEAMSGCWLLSGKDAEAGALKVLKALKSSRD